MRRKLFSGAAAITAAAAVLPAAALASVIELGSTRSAVVAPGPCTTSGTKTTCPNGVDPSKYQIILTRVTALETVRDGTIYPTTVKKAGRIVAFTVGLSQLDTNRTTAKSEIHYLDHTYGGTTQVAITVLRRVGLKRNWRWRVVAESPIFHVQPYLGQVVQLPLETTIPVVPGEVVALTTPTWAPILTINLSTSRFAYRQSRTTSCSSPAPTSAAQLRAGQTARYVCDYPGTRVEYSATEITNPVAINPIHARDAGR